MTAEMFMRMLQSSVKSPAPPQTPGVREILWAGTKTSFGVLGSVVKATLVHGARMAFTERTVVLTNGYPEESTVMDWKKTALIGGFVSWRLYRKWRERQERGVAVYTDALMTKPESMIAGNDLIPSGNIPDCQVSVALMTSTGLCIVGAGIRLENWLVMPCHNMRADSELWLIGKDINSRVKVTSDRLDLAPDVVAFAVSQGEWARLGTKVAKLGPLGGKTTATVTSSCDSRYSVAELSPAEIIGRVKYYGSTVAGFSGSAYMNGRICLGIHMHGGNRAGGGYESLYLWARLKHAVQQIPETDSTTYLSSAARDGWEAEELDTDTFLVRLSSGHVHLTNAEAIRRLEELEEHTSFDKSAWEDYNELEDALAYRSRHRKYFPEGLLVHQAVPNTSGEGQKRSLEESHDREPRKESPKGGRSPAPKGASMATHLPELTSLLKGLSEKQLRSLSKAALDKVSTLQPKNSSSQTARLKPSGKASVSNTPKPQNEDKV